MSDSPSAPSVPPTLPAERMVGLENRIFLVSPLGFAATICGLFGLCFASFSLASLAAGSEVFSQLLVLGFALSATFATALALSEMRRRLWSSWRADLDQCLLPAGQADVDAMTKGAPAKWRPVYTVAFIGGALLGVALNFRIALVQDIPLDQYYRSIGLWFLIVTSILYGLGLRAIVDMVRVGRELRHVVDHHLDVDLFHLDRLHVFGRLGVRSALSWLILAAVLLLFFIDGDNAWTALPAFGLSALGGGSVLFAALRPVHLRIQAAKAAELDRVRDQMSEARDKALTGDTAAAGALAGLTDFEQWVDQRSEWPISHSISTRFALYILIPVIPIAASWLFEKVADSLVFGAAL